MDIKINITLYEESNGIISLHYRRKDKLLCTVLPQQQSREGVPMEKNFFSSNIRLGLKSG